MLLLSPFIKLLSLLPLKWLYGISNILHFFIYHVFTYRRVTVRRNLCMSFPDKTSKEIRQIEKQFYKHFSDLIVEGIKSFSLTAESLEHRITVSNLDLIEKFIAKDKSVLGVLGHIGNWEWAVLRLAQIADFPVHALYQPSSSKRFDNWLTRNRQRFGALLVSTKQLRPLFRNVMEHPVAIGSLVDQTPVHVDKAHWMNFMRQPTPVYTGSEKMAIQYDMAVIYVSINKTGRGFYHINFELITDQPRQLQEHEITETHTRMLENSIIQQPEIWLWTHRRWKRSHLKPGHFK
ncbi:MAG: lysophospholipid acyltransferase family protein [Bacteroidetes bacterium]|nr:lysophospholipid acyltransferase family protein [Bacteroidota bacterium]